MRVQLELVQSNYGDAAAIGVYRHQMALNCSEHRVHRKLVQSYTFKESSLRRRPYYTCDPKLRITLTDMSKMRFLVLVNLYL